MTPKLKPRVVTILNEKGGVGKTTINANLGAGLARAGFKVLIIDTDRQGHAGLLFGLDKRPDLYDMIVRQAVFDDVITRIPDDKLMMPDEEGNTFVKGSLHIVRSNYETKGIVENVSGGDRDGDFSLYTTLLDLYEDPNWDFDYILIDTAPTDADMHTMIYVATDVIIYPALMEFLSLDGLKESYKHLTRANRIRRSEGLPDIEHGGIIANQVRNTIEHQERYQQVMRTFKDIAPVYPAMPLHTKMAQSITAKQSIFAYDPWSKASKHMQTIVNYFLKLEGHTINEQ